MKITAKTENVLKRKLVVTKNECWPRETPLNAIAANEAKCAVDTTDCTGCKEKISKKCKRVSTCI